VKAVILAGGLGERLRPLTRAIPKALFPIGEKSLLEIQISHLARDGFDEIFIATNYKSQYIETFIGDGKRFNVRILYSRETQPLGTCGPLSLLRKQLTEPFLVMNGDILTTMDFGRFFEYGTDQNTDLVVATKKIRTPFNFGSVHTESNRIIRVDEKPDLLIEIVAGIYFMRPPVLSLVPDDHFFGMNHLISGMLSAERAIGRYLMEEYWLDIGNINDYNEAEDAYRTHFEGVGVRGVAAV
jgi:NDP-sugar pyrophosphorylase family protein